MLFKSRKRRKPGYFRRGSALGSSRATTMMSRGIVTVSICAGASMWGYAMINLAT